MIDIKVKLLDGGKMPTKGTTGAAAYDCYANADMYVNGTVIVPLGFSIELPPGYHAKILPRSSIGRYTTLRLANSCGIIDSDYRGEVGAIYESSACEPIKRGDRIAQMLIEKAPEVCLVEVEELDDTERGAGGFGSTGR